MNKETKRLLTLTRDAMPAKAPQAFELEAIKEPERILIREL